MPVKQQAVIKNSEGVEVKRVGTVVVDVTPMIKRVVFDEDVVLEDDETIEFETTVTKE